MTSSFDPRGDYPRRGAGEAGGQFEVDARVWEAPLVNLVRVEELGYNTQDPWPTSIALKLDVTKPDYRLAVELVIAFRVSGEDVSLVSMDSVQGNGRTFAQNLADSTIWLALLGNVGGADVEVEDIIGTRLAPESMVSEGTWGATYEVDVACQGIRATLNLLTPVAEGNWMAKARWIALQPMSERDWEHARQNMRIELTGGLGVHPDINGRKIEVYREAPPT